MYVHIYAFQKRKAARVSNVQPSTSANHEQSTFNDTSLQVLGLGATMVLTTTFVVIRLRWYSHLGLSMSIGQWLVKICEKI